MFFDLKALEKGGVDGIIFENNYDFPTKSLLIQLLLVQ